jgi:alpha,alpha-trehalose phosphorylase
MIKRDPVLPPEFIYPIDDWRLVETKFTSKFIAQNETVMSTANGYLGMRGGFYEGEPAFLHGTYINGFYETWPIPYGERAYGFAKTGQTIVNVPDGKVIRLYIDDEPFTVDTANLLQYERALDMRGGTFDRQILWETPSGKQVQLRASRLVSFTERHLAAIMYEVTVLNAAAPVVLVSELASHRREVTEADDPRLARAFKEEVLVPEGSSAEKQRVLLSFITRSSRLRLACGMEHLIETDCAYTTKSSCPDSCGQVVFSIDACEGKPIRIFKYLTYHTAAASESAAELRARAERTLDRAKLHGFTRLAEDQRKYLDDFWQRSDIELDLSATQSNPRLQQCIRWNLFQLLQATGRTDDRGVPAKGLTGQAYEGHYFWDMETYVQPFLIYTAPRIARNLLMFRYHTLDKARQRAREVSQKGALYPWRTISGEEASAYYAAGTAQYHINAAIAYTIKKFVEVTGDTGFLRDYGCEMLVETARLWHDLGFFSDRLDGKFCIHGVTGPDEYTTVVNNNAYTNMMARENLWYAAHAVEWLRKEHPRHYVALAHRTSLDPSEPGEWKRAGDLMYIPFDKRTGINPQDDSFLDREVWDLASTSKEKFPLLLHYHPLVIYRYQVLKQADIVLAMFLLGNEFSFEQKKRNFDYYDPLTTGDSSLSACIQAIEAFEIGYDEKALRYFNYAVLMDLADVGGNVRDGVHIASIGGTWMAVVYGLAGMRDYNGQLSFDPKPFLRKLKFALTIRNQRLEVDIANGAVRYLINDGPGLMIRHRGEELRLAPGEAISRTL